MLWIKMGWRNLWRNRRRSLIELTSIAGSVFLAVFMNNLAVGSYALMIDTGVRMGSGHIGLYRSDYLELRKTELTMKTDTLISALERDPAVNAVYPRLNVPCLIRSSRDSRSSVVIGMDIAREKDNNPVLKAEKIVEGELPSDNDSQGALMGETLAKELGLKVGNKFVVMTQGSDGEIASRLLRVTGLIRTNARMIDAVMVIVPRKVLGDIIGETDSAHEIAVMLHDHRMIEKTLPRIRAIARTQTGVDAFQWEKAMPGLANAIKMDHVGLQIMVVFMYLIVGIGTINTLLMSVMERTREFGVIRAIGVSRTGIRKMVLSEAFVLAVTGVVAGIFLASVVGLYTANKGIDFSYMIEDQGIAGVLFDPVMYSGWAWLDTFMLCGGMIVLALLASLYPAHYIMKIQPSEAMRKY